MKNLLTFLLIILLCGCIQALAPQEPRYKEVSVSELSNYFNLPEDEIVYGSDTYYDLLKTWYFDKIEL